MYKRIQCVSVSERRTAVSRLQLYRHLIWQLVVDLGDATERQKFTRIERESPGYSGFEAKKLQSLSYIRLEVVYTLYKSPLSC